MSVLVTEAVWLNEAAGCSLEDLAQASGLSAEELQEFIASGVIEPMNAGAEQQVFRTSCIVIARTARRLRDDFELDTRGVSVALSLLRRIEELEAQVQELHAKLPRRL